MKDISELIVPDEEKRRYIDSIRCDTPREGKEYARCAENLGKLIAAAQEKMVGRDFSVVNPNATPRKGGRKGKVISFGELRGLILEATQSNEYVQYRHENDVDEIFECDNRLLYSFIGCKCSARVTKDLAKIGFDFENILFEDWKKTEAGIPYALCIGGGDWETPVVFCIYYDGKSLRGYVPSCGNSYNYICNKAFGTSDAYEDAKFVCKELGIKFTLEDPDECDEFLGAIGFETEWLPEIDWDFRTVHADISSRIEVL